MDYSAPTAMADAMASERAVTTMAKPMTNEMTNPLAADDTAAPPSLPAAVFSATTMPAATVFTTTPTVVEKTNPTAVATVVENDTTTAATRNNNNDTTSSSGGEMMMHGCCCCYTLETLPLDSLHAIAGCLPVADFINGFGRASKTCRLISKEILRRVRRHGFFCATQVLAAHLADEPDDAIQLAGLYISRGIPMYCNHPKAYASIVFRMKHSAGGAGGTSSSSSSGGVAATAAANGNHLYHHPFHRHREASYLDEKKALLLPGKKLKIHQHLLELHQQQQQHGNNIICIPRHDDANRAFQLGLSADFFRRDNDSSSTSSSTTSSSKQHDDATTMTTTTTTKNLGSFELEVYSAESLKNVQTELQSKISIYQQKLETLLTKSDDAAGFEECMLDFWDEFFPETRGMHYYDSETAVPRASYLHEFLTNPCPKAWGTVRCEIERIKTGSRLFPVYEYRLYVRGTPTDMELMFAKNKGRQEGKSNNFQIVMGGDSSDNTTNSMILGRLQSNFIGTEFSIFVVAASSSSAASLSSISDQSKNANPAARPSSVTHKRTNRRAIANQNNCSCSTTTDACREDGAITYTANLLGSRPRIMDVCLPKIAVQENDVTWATYLVRCGGEDPTDMLTCFRQLVARLDHENNNTNGDNGNENANAEIPEFGLLALQNRPPWWNHELQSFVLNFGGRVSVASVKNFQLIERTNHDVVMLQFGRIKGRHSFTMDYTWPLTAVQAFGIAISSLQSKISFG